MIRLQDKTPEVYCAESRDFQLFCRLYDCVVNGIKFDIDTIPDILDGMTCRSSMLQLLQTKVGFFTNKRLTDDALRYVLTAFPIMIKNKGSLKAIQQAVNVFFKVNGIKSEVQIWAVSEPTQVYDTWVEDHTIVIGINSIIKDVSLLEEIFRYILPPGFKYYFYFYNKIYPIESFMQSDKATLLFASGNVNSQVRGEEYGDDVINRLLNAVDTISIASIDSPIKTLNGTYRAGDDNMFLGVFNSIEEAPTANIKEDSTILVNGIQYIYRSGWQSINFRGSVKSLELVLNPKEYDVVCVPSEKSYYYKDNGTYVSLKYRGVVSTPNDVLFPEKYDFVKCKSSSFVRTDLSWVEYLYLTKVFKLPEIAEAKEDTIYYLDTYKYYMFNNGVWNETYVPVYMLSEVIVGDEV